MSSESQTSACTHLVITGLDRRGHGISQDSQGTVTVPGAFPAETVYVEIYEARGRRFGRLREVVKPSPQRIPAECPFVDFCPGCTLRSLSLKAQRELKNQRTLADLRQYISVDVPAIDLGQTPRNQARSRAVAHAMTRTDGTLVLGMKGRDEAHIPLSECPIHTRACRRLLGKLQRDLNDLKLSAYDPLTRTGQVRHVIVEEFGSHDDEETCNGNLLGTERVVVCFGRPVDHQGLEDYILVDEPQVSVLIDVLPYRGAAALSTPTAIRNHPSIMMRAGTDLLQATLPAWTSQSPKTAGLLRVAARDWLQPKPGDRILEVGCGIGTLSFALARQCRFLTGIDACRVAIEDAWTNAHRLKISNVEFRMGVASKALVRIFNRQAPYDLVLLHGMRRPFGDRAMSIIHSMKPRCILYVGPNARSIGEDLQNFVDYRVEKLGGLDQTPGTMTLLNLVLLTRI